MNNIQGKTITTLLKGVVNVHRDETGGQYIYSLMFCLKRPHFWGLCTFITKNNYTRYSAFAVPPAKRGDKPCEIWYILIKRGKT